MGKEQGDGLPAPTYYRHESFADLRPAYVPADHVNLKARGWIEVPQEESPAGGEDAQAADEAPEDRAGVRPAGSQRREAARVVPGQPVAAPADGGSSV